MKRTIVFLCIMLGSFVIWGQKANGVDEKPKEKPKPVQTEQVEGFWEVVGYFGGKLSDEVARRMNIETEKEKGVPTQVDFEFGWFSFSRVEERPKK
jgi:hypothetical protein